MRILTLLMAAITLASYSVATPQQKSPPPTVVAPVPVQIVLSGHASGQAIFLATQGDSGKAAIVTINLAEDRTKVSLIATPTVHKNGTVTVGYVVNITRVASVENGQTLQDEISVIGEQTGKLEKPLTIFAAGSSADAKEPALGLMITVKKLNL